MSCHVCKSDDRYDTVMNDHLSRYQIALFADHGTIEVCRRDGSVVATAPVRFCPMCGEKLGGDAE